ncbi:MAG TPA: type II toxin-antitoxin system VapC family toxin [Mycobacteriales bacterium]|nr:type II toxin-antitoxin system VapC family toxin [Mycobacteriales bacterium]
MDTDVISLIMKSRLPPDETVLTSRICYVSFVTVGELAKGAAEANWGVRRRTELADWLHKVGVLPYDIDVSYNWGQLSAEARRRGRSRPVNDTWIAACCLTQGLPLMTRNLKDYVDFAEHHGLILEVNQTTTP